MRFLGLLAYLADVFLDRIAEYAADLHDRDAERGRRRRVEELRSMDADAVRREGDIGSLILARHIELAKAMDREC